MILSRGLVRDEFIAKCDLGAEAWLEEVGPGGVAWKHLSPSPSLKSLSPIPACPAVAVFFL